MAQYDTWTKTKDDITVTVSKAKDQSAGGRLKAFLEWLSESVTDPGYGKPEGGSPPKPDQGLPGKPPGTATQPRPDNELPGQGGRPTHPIAPGGGGGKPDQGLPGEQPGPDQGLPGSQPGIDNSLPKEHIDEIVKLVLGKCTDCNVAQPK